MHYIDESVALGRMLADEDRDLRFVPSDPVMHALHRTMYAAWPDVESVVSGWSRHLRALLVEGCALPTPTRMMRKRGVSDLRDHLVDPGALAGSQRDLTLAQARETATRNGMTYVLLVATGESDAVKTHGGTLLHPIERVRVKALPDHLPQSITYDIAALVTFDDVIHLRDLAIPADVTLLTDPDEIVARVAPPRVEEVVVAPVVEAPAEGAESAEAGAAGAAGTGSSGGSSES